MKYLIIYWDASDGEGSWHCFWWGKNKRIALKMFRDALSKHGEAELLEVKALSPTGD